MRIFGVPVGWVHLLTASQQCLLAPATAPSSPSPYHPPRPTDTLLLPPRPALPPWLPAVLQPWVLGVVFVAVAVVSWTRVAAWRSHRGAGYRSTAHSHV